jgi:hypothetical protein
MVFTLVFAVGLGLSLRLDTAGLGVPILLLGPAAVLRAAPIYVHRRREGQPWSAGVLFESCFVVLMLVVSALIAFAIDRTPGLKLRASEEAELLGMDDDQLGEFAYDYVEVRRDYLAWTPQKTAQLEDGHEIPPADRYGIGEHSEMLEYRTPTENASKESEEDRENHRKPLPPAPRQVAEQDPLGEDQLGEKLD